MSLADQFSLALEFMLLGMGVVFTFLAFLVLVVKGTGTLVQKIECARSSLEIPSARVAFGSGSAGDETLTAVITAAVHQYRRQYSSDQN